MSACTLYAPGSCPLCDDAGRAQPFRAVSRRTGAMLLRYAHPVTSVFRLLEGRVRLSVSDVAGGERAYAVRGPGSYVGLEGLIGLSALRDARVARDSRLEAATTEDLKQYLQAEPRAAMAALEHAILEHARLSGERALVDGTAEQRLARFLIESGANPLLSPWQEVPRQEIAGLLAIRPETLSRAVRHLQDRGAISGELKVLDPGALREAAGEAAEDSEE